MTDQLRDQKPFPPAYLFWRRRVEGQIRHTMNEHPEWFRLPDQETKERCVRSMAKRIIGEIVAGRSTGGIPDRGAISSASRSALRDVQLASASSQVVSGTVPADHLLSEEIAQ